MKNIKTSIALLIIILGFVSGYCQFENPFSITYSVEELHEDFDIFRNEFETMHAGLYIYTPKEDMDAAFDNLKASIDQPMTAPAFYKHLLKMNAYIKNGHTVIRPSAEFDHHVMTDWAIFPFDVHWSNGSLYILRNMSDNPEIVEGTLIKSINGELADELFLDMASNWNRDGSNTSFPEGITERAFAEFYANQRGLPAKFNMDVILPDGSEQLLEVVPVQGTKRSDRRAEQYGEIKPYWDKSDGDALTVEIEDRTAILTLRHCGNTDVREFMRTIKSQFNKIFKKINEAGVQHLVIDIRNNPGGNDKPTIELMRHLVAKPFRLYEEDYLINRKVSKYYTSNRGYYNFLGGLVLKKDDNGLYRPNFLAHLLFGDGSTEFQKPAKEQFTGQIYTLTNYATFSAGGYLASMLEQHTNSIFIGEEPGGNANECVAGQYFDLELPNTKNRVLMQVVHSQIVVDRENNGHGVIPDYPIRPTIADKINKRDPEMEFTMQLIRNSDLHTTDIVAKNK